MRTDQWALIKAKADINAKTTTGHTAISIAVVHRHFSIINMLQTAGEDMTQLTIDNLCMNNDENDDEDDHKKCLLDPVNYTCLEIDEQNNKGIEINENFGQTSQKGTYCYQSGELDDIMSKGNRKDPMDRSKIKIVNVTKLVKLQLDTDENATQQSYRKQGK